MTGLERFFRRNDTVSSEPVVKIKNSEFDDKMSLYENKKSVSVIKKILEHTNKYSHSVECIMNFSQTRQMPLGEKTHHTFIEVECIINYHKLDKCP